MSDITELFSQVAHDAGQPSPELVEADLARGRTALARDHRRRTIRRSALAGTAVVTAAAVAVLASQLGENSNATHHPVAVTHHRTAVKSHRPTATAPAHRSSIKLVSYNGDQLHGFTVDKVPDGWFLSTSSQFALLIDPAGSTDNDPDAFEGKLAVLLQSQDAHGLGNGDAVTVNGQDGRVLDQGKYGETLTYTDGSGHTIQIQAPLALGWGDAQIVSFAEGVHVTPDALAGVG